MTNLSHIFPSDYLNPPTEMDLQYEVQDMLRHTEYPPNLLSKINSLPCPYYKEALMVCFKKEWKKMVEEQDSRTGYYDSDGRWVVCWQEAEVDMRKYIKRFRNEQDTHTYAATNNEIPATIPPAPTIVKQITSGIKQAVEEIVKLKEVAQYQPITININIHNYNAPIGQNALNIEHQDYK